MSALILILAAIAIAAIVGFLLLAYAGDGYSLGAVIGASVGTLLLIAAGVSAISYAYMAWRWMAADSKAQIINREYGTNYTREEVFFASDVIDTIREIDRKRVEVNGDLLRENKD